MSKAKENPELQALKDKYQGLTNDELLAIISRFESETDSVIEELKSLKSKSKSDQEEISELKKELKSKASELTEAIKEQGSLQQKYFKKTFDAHIKGKIKMSDGASVMIRPGVFQIGVNPNLTGDFNFSTLELEDGEKISIVHKGNVRLAPLVKFQNEVPEFKDFLQKLYDAKVNIFANQQGQAIFERGGEQDPKILKLKKK